MTSTVTGDENGAPGKTSLVDPFPEMLQESTNLTLVAMMGLPASGKSTLANQLVNYLSKFQVVIVSFDDFVPLSMQAKICEDMALDNHDDATETDGDPFKSMSAIKILRKQFANCVESIVKYAKDSSYPNPATVEQVGYVNTLETTLAQYKCTKWALDGSFLSKTQAILDKLSRVNVTEGDLIPPKNVIIVDDNNYYHSMRNSLYQIAKLVEVGFCLINCKVPLKTCAQRNLQRPIDFQVPHKAVVEMGLKYEEPNPLHNPCDMYCVEVNTNEEVNLALLEQVICSSFSNFPRNAEDRTVEIDRERRICSENEIHQADLVLRKWISKKLNLSSFSDGLLKSADARKTQSRELNRKKRLTLEKFRSGEFKIAFNVSQEIEFRNEIIELFENLDA